MANLDAGAERYRWWRDRNPIQAFDFEAPPAKGFVLADNDAIRLRINRENIERLAGGESEALALADGEIVNAVVAANHLAIFVDNLASRLDRKSTRLNSSHGYISYAVFCLEKKNR